MKKLLLMVLVLFLLTSSAGCSQQTEPSNESEVSVTEAVENPFESNDADTVVMGGISHGPESPKVDKNNNLVPWVYNGKEVKIDYYVNASGQAKNVGFFIFVNGMPQPYKVNDTNASYEYMHTFKLKKDNENVPFTFLFSPVTGKKGETLNVTITSFYNPSFIPDMDKTSSYGGYHAILPATYQLTYKADANASEYKASGITGAIKLSKEPVTDKLLETLSKNSLRDIDMDTFNNEIFNQIYYDNALKTDNYKVKDKETLHITYKLCGCAGLEYTTTFYINHKPISFSKGISVDTTIEKGSVSVMELDINSGDLADFNTFYAISIPKNAKEFPDGIFEAIKTPSILLYK